MVYVFFVITSWWLFFVNTLFGLCTFYYNCLLLNLHFDANFCGKDRLSTK